MLNFQKSGQIWPKIADFSLDFEDSFLENTENTKVTYIIYLNVK